MIFLTTQYLEEADELANQIAVLDRGKLVAEGTPDLDDVFFAITSHPDTQKGDGQ